MMKGSKSSRGPASEFLPTGDSLRLHGILSTQGKHRGRRRGGWRIEGDPPRRKQNSTGSLTSHGETKCMLRATANCRGGPTLGMHDVREIHHLQHLVRLVNQCEGVGMDGASGCPPLLLGAGLANLRTQYPGGLSQSPEDSREPE